VATIRSRRRGIRIRPTISVSSEACHWDRPCCCCTPCGFISLSSSCTVCWINSWDNASVIHAQSCFLFPVLSHLFGLPPPNEVQKSHRAEQWVPTWIFAAARDATSSLHAWIQHVHQRKDLISEWGTKISSLNEPTKRSNSSNSGMQPNQTVQGERQKHPPLDIALNFPNHLPKFNQSLQLSDPTSWWRITIRLKGIQHHK